eukprot:g3456.t1
MECGILNLRGDLFISLSQEKKNEKNGKVDDVLSKFTQMEDDEEDAYFSNPATGDTGATWLVDALKSEEQLRAESKTQKPRGNIDTSFYQRLRGEGRGRRISRREENETLKRVLEYQRKPPK